MEIRPTISTPFFFRNKRWTIRELRLQHGKLDSIAEDGDVYVFSVDDFRLALSKGEVQRVAQRRSGEEYVVPPTWRNDETERAKQERTRREEILRVELEHVGNGATLKEAYSAIRALCEEKKWPIPSERTLRNWRNLARGHESMLSPQWHLSGNRRQGPDELLLDAMSEVCEHALLDNNRFNLTDAWKTVEALYHKKCQGDETRPPQIPRRISIRQLKRFLCRVDWIEQMGTRLDARTRRALTRIARGHNKADYLWEVVEIDAKVLEVVVRDEDGNEIGRPILYLAVDVATRYVVGFALTIQKPSVLPFVDCLRYMYFPKPEGFDEKYGIKFRIELFGKPIKLRVDNGSEFIKAIAVELVRQLHGDSARCKPYQPWEKPHVERAFDDVKQEVKKYAGSKLCAITGKTREVPAGEKLLTLEELKGRLLRFFYDDFALRVNESRSLRNRSAVGAIDLVRKLKAEQIEPFPVSEEEFNRATHFKRDTRALSHSGIDWDGFTYHSEELAALYAQTGPGKHQISYSDMDATTIYVHPSDGPDTGTPAFAKELEGLQVDRATARQIRRDILRTGKELNKRTFANRLAEFEAQKAKPKSARERNRQARIQDRLERARALVAPTMPKASKAAQRSTASTGQPLRPVPDHSSPEPSSKADTTSPQPDTNLPHTTPRGRMRGQR